ESGDADAQSTRAAYDYLQAKHEITGEPLDIPALTDDNGDLKPWDQLSDEAKTSVRSADGVGAYTDVNFYNPAGRFDQAALDEKGTNFEKRVDDYLDGTQ